MELIALVPMKGVSERVPNKNMRLFDGEPLFFKILKTLLQVPTVRTIAVNTDSAAIKNAIQRHFPTVKVIDRPVSLQGNNVQMNRILEYDMGLLEGRYFLQTHATNPLLTPSTLSKAIDSFFHGLAEGHDSLFSANVIQSRLYDAQKRPINHSLDALVNSQELTPIYEENSNIFIFSRESFLRRKHRIGSKPIIFEMSRIEGVDIDYEDDFRIAESVYAWRKEAEKTQ